MSQNLPAWRHLPWSECSQAWCHDGRCRSDACDRWTWALGTSSTWPVAQGAVFVYLLWLHTCSSPWVRIRALIYPLAHHKVLLKELRYLDAVTIVSKLGSLSNYSPETKNESIWKFMGLALRTSKYLDKIDESLKIHQLFVRLLTISYTYVTHNQISKPLWQI